MHASYSDRYVIKLPDNHRFPIIKYSMIRERLISDGTLRAAEIAEPKLAEREDILLVHSIDYYDRLATGQLTAREVRRLGLPWSEALVSR